MNITIIARTLKQVEGGGAISADFLIRQLLKKKHKIKVVTFDGETNKTFKKDGIQYLQRKKSRIYPPVTITINLKAARIMKKLEKKTDVFYIPQADMIPGGGFYKLFGGKKKVVGMLNGYSSICAVFQCTVDKKVCYNCSFFNQRFKCVKKFSRNPFEKYIFAPVYASLFKLMNEIPAKKLDQYIALSEPVKNIHSSFGFDKERITVVPNMYDENFVKSNIIKEKKDEFRILYVGRMKKSKGVDVLVKAFQKIKHKNKKLVLIGSGTEMNKIKKLISEIGEGNNILIKNYVKYEELYKYYKQADVFVHPGIWPEPFGRTILEAISCQIPIIVSDIGAPPEIIAPHGLKFKPGDVDDLKNKLEKVMKNKVPINKLVPPLNVLGKFSPKIVVKKIESILTQFEK